MEHVTLSKLKAWARKRLPQGDPVRLAIESQPDQVSPEEFLIVLKTWDLMAATQ
jgi:hypothetical protein